MSYQRREEEEDLLLPVQDEFESAHSASTGVCKIMMFSFIVIGTFLLAVMMASDYPNTQASLSSARLQMAKEGAIMYSSLSDDDKSDLFDEFKETFSRKYADKDAEEEAFSNFKAFLKLVDERNEDENKKDGTAVHGMTIFADMSESEFKKTYLTFKKNEDVEVAKKFGKSAEDEKEMEMSEVEIDRRRAERALSTDATTWVDVYTTPVKDQGYCGSCWAFSAVQQIESDSIRAGYLTTSEPLSVQQLVSCDTYDYGCEGGYPVYAYYYVYKTGGVELNSTYPYTSYYDDDGTCTTSSDDYVVSLTDFYYFTSETGMEKHVLNTGPLSICVDASTWSSYTSGIISSCGKSVDHCVQAVGVDLENDYWIVRNSWGTEWGVDGYIYLKTDENMCDITYLPTYVEPSEV